MITGVEIRVLRPEEVEYDRFGNETYSEETAESVQNVLIVPGATDNLEASRPQGVSISYTLHFPKTYNKSLRGCKVVLPKPWDGTYKVVGDPKPYMDGNTPTKWHMPVEVEVAHG